MKLRYKISRLGIMISRLSIGFRSTESRVNQISCPFNVVTASKSIGKSMTHPAGFTEDAVNDGGQAQTGNKVMVVVDSRLDSEAALEWTLTRTVHGQHDCIVLIHVVKPFSIGDSEYSMNFNLRAHDILRSMKSMCKAKKPLVKVEMAMVEGEKKGEVILEEAKRQRVTLLVLGQMRRRRPSVCGLVHCWLPGKRQRHQVGTVEYCIQHAGCMAIAVRRKSRKLGGYLITTKRHKNFWLLA